MFKVTNTKLYWGFLFFYLSPTHLVRTGNLKKSQHKVSCVHSHLHVHDEACEVVCSLPGVNHGGEIVQISCPPVPVHYNNIHVLLLCHQVNQVVDPDRGRSSRPVPVDNKGSGA